MSNEFFSYEQAQSELSVSQNELNQLVKDGELRAFRQGDDLRFKRDDVIALKKSRETEPTIILSDTHASRLSPASEERPIDLESISTDETVLNIEGLLEEESEGTTPIPSTSGLGEDTVLDTEGLDLDADFDLTDEVPEDREETLRVGPGRQVQMVKRQSHAAMTVMLTLTMAILLAPCAVLMNLMRGPDGTFAKWVENLTFMNSGVDSILGLFR